jgi:sarcosine oxidase subunit alpha
VGSDPDAGPLARALAAAGAEVVPVMSLDGGRVAGRVRVCALHLPDGRVPCDTLVVSGPPAPAIELGRALGAATRWDATLGAPALAVGPRGETGAPGVLAAGEVAGAMGVTAAAEAGRRAGEAARG